MRVFDPTPPEGRPGVAPGTGGGVLALGWQQLESTWDRWVLTFSMADQVDLARRALDAISVARRFLAGVVLGLGALGALVALLTARRKASPGLQPATGRRSPCLTRALRSLMGRAGRQGIPVSPAMTAREFQRDASRMCPAVREPLAWLVAQHERARYGGWEPPGRRAVRTARRAAEKALSRR